MKKFSKLCLVMFALALVLVTGCGSKEEPKVEETVITQSEAVKEDAGTEEVVDTAVVEEQDTEVVLEQEASKGEDIDYLAIHKSNLDKIYSWVMEGYADAQVSTGEEAIIDAIKGFGEYAHYDLGFATEDVNEDGIPELLIGQTTQEGIGNMIYAIYTWKDGNFQCNVEGADYGPVAPGRVNEENVIYFTPFAHYEPNSKIEFNVEVSATAEPMVAVQWLEDVYVEPNGYDVFTADDRAEQRQVVFIAISEVSNFKVLELNFDGVDKDGSVMYTSKGIYSQSELKPERPLMVGMSCDSTIPCYGFAYEDANGNTRNFAIEVSGMDGSVLISEF